MKKLITLFSVAVMFSIGCTSNHSIFSSSKHDAGETETDQPDAMIRWEYNRVKDQKTGAVPIQNLVDAYNRNMQQQNNGAEAAVSGITWTERGPNNVGGRTRVILFDKKDLTYKTVFAASVGGGLFKCTDIDATTPTWTKVNDFFANLAICCMVQHPVNYDTLYFGTGEGFFNGDAIQGAGVWRSFDRGVTWTQLASSMGGSVPGSINRLAVTSTGTIYAATTNGLFKSTNNGTSWTAELTTGTTPATSNNTGYDVKIDAAGDIYYGCYAQVWKYSGGSWTNKTPAGTYQRIEIACAPSDANYVYLLCQGSGSGVGGFFSSSNAAGSWTSRTVPLIYDQASTATTEMSRNQAWYDLTLMVQPDTATIVYAGAIDFIKSKDAGATYKQISAWSLANMPAAANLGSNQVMHSDHHVMAFKPGNSAYALIGCDGGLYKTTNLTNTFGTMPTYTAINTNYNVTQYYSCAAANVALSNNFIAGAQDNGSHKFSSAGINSVSAVSGGDGCFVFIDQTNNLNQITSYVYNNYYVSTNASSFTTLSGSDNTGDFVNPSDLDGVNDILYTKGGSGTIARWTSVFGTPTRTNLTITGVTNISHIKVSPNTPTTIYIGTDAGYVYRITGANTATSPITPTLLNSSAFGGRISCIDVRKCAAATDDTILVSQSNYGLGNSVLVTKNGTAGTPTWTDIDDNSTLPNIPVNWCLFAPTLTAKEAMLATELGIYTCDDIYAATPVWGQSNTGFANVRVDMIRMRSADSLIVAATHGRGLYTTYKYTASIANFSSNKQLTYITSPIQFTDESVNATSWAWDFDNNGSIDATTQNPTWAYGTAGFKTVALTINGNLTKTLTNYIQILPNLATPFTTAQGGNFESNPDYFGSQAISGSTNLWVRGTPTRNLTTLSSASNGWKTQLGADVPSGTYQCALYTPNFNLSNSGTYALNFQKSMENYYCNAPFAFQVQYSTDLGNTWTTLGAYGDGLGTNWYNCNPSGGCPMATGVFSNQQGWITTINNQATSYNISSLAGNKNVAFRFVFSVASGYPAIGYQKDGVLIDDVTITSSTSNNPALEVETVVTSKAENFGPSATVDFYSSNGKILARLVNNSTFDYGLTTVSIDNAGTGAMNYSTNTAAGKQIFQKTLTINPTNNNTSGNYTITLYYDPTEYNGWKSATGNYFSGANIIKCPVNIASGTLVNGIYGTSVSRALYGAFDSTITATFGTGFSGFGAGADIIVLPVELMAFTARKKDLDARLEWSTASEKNNAGFYIERSTDASHWEKAGFVSGKGNSVSISQYTFTDVNALENKNLLYYRLRQTDLNGAFAYSPIRIVENIMSGITVSLAPVPAKDVLQISTSLEQGFTYRILSADGKILREGNTDSGTKEVELKGLKAGTYYLQISNHNTVLSTKPFIKVE